MKPRLAWMLGLAMMGCLSFPGWGEEQKPAQKTSEFLEQLQVKLEHTAQRANQPGGAGSSVIGLRGAKQEPVSKQLYWKGKKGSEPVNLEEVKALRLAVEQARAGQKAEALAALNRFEAKYPKSPLLADAKEAQRQLMSAVVAPAAPASATPSK